MKLEIEITEEEIKSAMERKVRVAIADQTSGWSVDNYIKERVKELWKGVADELIAEALKDAPALKASIAAEVERKLRNQLAQAMKNVK